jgi:hypothetical protein
MNGTVAPPSSSATAPVTCSSPTPEFLRDLSVNGSHHMRTSYERKRLRGTKPTRRPDRGTHMAVRALVLQPPPATSGLIGYLGCRFCVCAIAAILRAASSLQALTAITAVTFVTGAKALTLRQLSRRCRHEAIFGAKRSVANDPGRVKRRWMGGPACVRDDAGGDLTLDAAEC